MLGGATEVDGSMNRWRNMETRTPASKRQFVA